ncbi:MAG: PHP domain-containing protein [Clostridia bacterium]|nr:PHP domain-containing protein [Clostridia bacterium]
MREYFYDLHLHSCLSPCGDEDNTPNNIAGMASLCGLDIVALTDHNTCKNCPAFFEAAERCGIIPIAGMELTTSEDIHVVCLFERLEDAMRFDEFVDTARLKIKNKPNIFGEQLILDGFDNVIGKEEYLLPNATSISIEDAPDAVRRYGGICYPAHIDRMSNGIIAVLGTLPPSPSFSAIELHSRDKQEEYQRMYDLSGKKIVISSDAHYLQDMRDAENWVLLSAERDDPDAVRHELIKALGG